MAAVLALLLEQASGERLRVALTAPSGKAAARLKESVQDAGSMGETLALKMRPCGGKMTQKTHASNVPINRFFPFARFAAERRTLPSTSANVR